VNDIGQAVVPLLIAAPALVTAARRSTGRQRTSWYLLAAAAISWGLGQAVWTWFEVVHHEILPHPGLDDVGYLGSIPFLLAGVLTFPSRSLRTMGRARALLDVPFAEETGAIVPMGWWVLERACEQAQTWPRGQVSVNMAARQVLDPGAVTTVAAILARTGIDPRAGGARDHRVGAARRGGDRPPAPLPGRAAGHRRLRHRLLLAQLERLQSFGCAAAQGFLFGGPQVEPPFDLGPLRAMRPEGRPVARQA